MTETCTHLDQIKVGKPTNTFAKSGEDRRQMGSPAHVSRLREGRMLRFVQEQARHQTLPPNQASRDALGGARRGLDMVLY